MSDPNQHNTAVYSIPADEALEWIVDDRATEAANRKLQEANGREFILGRMAPSQRRLWRPADISLDAAVLSLPFNSYDTQIALFASRESPARSTGRLIVCSVVGNRINGSSSFVVPIDCPEDLARTVNAMAAWHESLVELSEAA